MALLEVKKLSDKIKRLEELLIIHISQEKDEDWIDDPKLVKKLDEIAEKEESISAVDVNL